MSEETPIEIDQEQERYAYAITRKLFIYTAVGTVLFSAGMIVLWYVMV